MNLESGARWVSQVCDTEIVVVHGSTTPLSLQCGGHLMVPLGQDRSQLAIDPDFADGALIGKRYTHQELGIEVLVTKAGSGSLAIDGVLVSLKDAKPLPSSD